LKLSKNQRASKFCLDGRPAIRHHFSVAFSMAVGATETVVPASELKEQDEIV
jgi:hypothetical protein